MSRLTAPTKALIIYATLATVFFGGLIALIARSQHLRETAPCSEFAGWPSKDVPARCFPGWRDRP